MRIGPAALAAVMACVLSACTSAGPPSGSGARPPAAPSAPASPVTPTPPATADVGSPTPEQTEGPYYKAGAPERAWLREGEGEPLTLSGRVLDAEGRPVAGATLDFWQAGPDGAYDNDGYRYRGFQRSASDGGWVLETVKPGPYATRTPHIHVRVTPPGGATLITQLYFPGEPRNATDGIFDERLLVRPSAEGSATFDFVLAP